MTGSGDGPRRERVAGTPGASKHGTGAAGQLSFALGESRPGTWSPLRPMLPRPAATAFDDSDFLFEPWWGGERAFLVVEAARIDAAADTAAATGTGDAAAAMGTAPGTAAAVRVLDKHGRDLAPGLPELADLAGQLSGHSAVLDGCLVVVDGREIGRASCRERVYGRV